uniref:Putative secretory protein n=1 Tax=Argas monolakensis TaxID=34602 RepID=Q09JN4_ARGMO|nr:putative secretory protein [Argas monolakensis]
MACMVRATLGKPVCRPLSICVSKYATEASEAKTVPSSEDPARKGQIAKQYPAYVLLEEGKQYTWCACGLSKKQPFCDGTHKSMEHPIKPVRFAVTETKKYLLCRCKQTNNRPFCDLSHIKTFIPRSFRSMLNIRL